MALDERVWALAAEGASVLVGAAGTDAWSVARADFTRILAGGDAEQEARLSAHLDAFAARLEPAGRDERERLRTENAPTWLNRLVRVLEEHQGATTWVREAINRVRDVLGPGYEGWTLVDVVVLPAQLPDPRVGAGGAAKSDNMGAIQGPPPGPEFPTPA